MIQYKGITENVSGSIVGIVTRNPFSLSRVNSIFVSDNPTILSRGFAAHITDGRTNKASLIPQINIDKAFLDKLVEGDCVLLDKDGVITVVWEKNAVMNPLLLTEMCDCRCRMCPQPPKLHDGTLSDICKCILSLIRVDASQTICLTGGEPTLLKQEFFDILTLIREKHPSSQVMLLTNGKSFSDFEFTKKFVSVRSSNFINCVSLHSDVDEEHDRIVGVKNSFYKTIKGLHNLARFRETIEIRVVVSRLNAQHLESIATFIYRNFPFIYHCVFMGMEITGLAIDNYKEIWIDPYIYRDQLSSAVNVLSRGGINVSVYNLPLCLINKNIWGFARQSISGWKNEYLSVCGSCKVKDLCGGVFTTSGLNQSPYIRPI
jgi:His-Xaa-Ser system radical SAM maturase HxsC